MSLQLTQFIVRDALVPALTATKRDQVIGELVDSLIQAGKLLPTDRKEVIEAILRRESLGTTGIGRGVGIPHTRHPSVNQLVGTIGITRDGADFSSLDGEPVHVVFLMISPQDQPRIHLQALEKIVSVMKNDHTLESFKAAETVDALWQLIQASAE